MSFLDNFTAKVPFITKTPEKEYFFALNIGPEKLTAAVWTIEQNRLRILGMSSGKYSHEEEIVEITDKLLDEALGGAAIEPEKILFGVQDSWLQDDNLKDPYLKLLRKLVKDLEVKPMAYVSTSHAIAHFLEKEENSPPTAVLAAVGEKYIRVMVLKAGRVEGSRILERGHELGLDIQNALLTFTNIEVLPSKILIYGVPTDELNKYRSELMSFTWNSKLSFLHLPRIDVVANNIEIKSISLAGAVEINPEVRYDNSADKLLTENKMTHTLLEKDEKESYKVEEKAPLDEIPIKLEDKPLPKEEETIKSEEDFGFGTGDVLERSPHIVETALPETIEEEREQKREDVHFTDNLASNEFNEDIEDDYKRSETAYERDNKVGTSSMLNNSEDITKRISKFPTAFLQPLLKGKGIFLGIVVVLGLLIAGYLFIPKAEVIVYIEPRILEKDAQVVADPSVKEVDEAGKNIPGEVVETEISGTEMGIATGKKKIGDPAKGVVVVYNKTEASKTLPKDTVLTGPDGLKFTLDKSVTIASQSAIEGGISFGKSKVEVTASAIGADGNLPSGSDFSITSFPVAQLSAKAEGNLSGGTSKEVTVVTDADQKKLLASLTTELKKKAKEELQGTLQDKKVLEEAFTEEVVKKSYSKNVNDQANDFSLNLTVKLKGLAIVENDLRTIVAKLVETNVPDNFVLNIAESETRADVSKVEDDGKVVFLARFRAKLIPKIDSDSIRDRIKAKTPQQAAEILKGYENVLGSDITISPPLPGPLQRLPFFGKNISIQISQK